MLLTFQFAEGSHEKLIGVHGSITCTCIGIVNSLRTKETTSVVDILSAFSFSSTKNFHKHAEIHPHIISMEILL